MLVSYFILSSWLSKTRQSICNPKMDQQIHPYIERRHFDFNTKRAGSHHKWALSSVLKRTKNVDSSIVILNTVRWKMVLMLTFWSLFSMITFSTSSRKKKEDQNTLLCNRSTYQSSTPRFQGKELLESLCFLQWLFQWRFSVSVLSKLLPSQPDLIKKWLSCLEFSNVQDVSWLP